MLVFAPSEMIVSNGEAADRMYIIAKGVVAQSNSVVLCQVIPSSSSSSAAASSSLHSLFHSHGIHHGRTRGRVAPRSRVLRDTCLTQNSESLNARSIRVSVRFARDASVRCASDGSRSMFHSVCLYVCVCRRALALFAVPSCSCPLCRLHCARRRATRTQPHHRFRGASSGRTCCCATARTRTTSCPSRS